MYVACRQMKVSVPGEDGKAKAITIEPGQTIPGAESWPYPNLIAHLNLQMIRWTGKEVPPHEAHKRKSVTMPKIFRTMAPPRQEAKALSSHSTEIPAKDPTPPSQGVSCEQCKKDFKTAAALKNHLKFKHQKESYAKVG